MPLQHTEQDTSIVTKQVWHNTSAAEQTQEQGILITRVSRQLGVLCADLWLANTYIIQTASSMGFLIRSGTPLEGFPLCEHSLHIAGALSWWAMPLGSWRTCLHVTYPPLVPYALLVKDMRTCQWLNGIVG
jgi:hypothetical protein